MFEDKILRLPEVMKITGLKRSSIYSYVKKNIFPKSIPLGIRAVGWLESEVREWVIQRANSRQS